MLHKQKEYLNPLRLPFPPDIEALISYSRPSSISKASHRIAMLRDRNRLINSRQDKPLNSLFMSMSQGRTRLLPDHLILLELLLVFGVDLIDELVSAEGLVIIHIEGL